MVLTKFFITKMTKRKPKICEVCHKEYRVIGGRITAYNKSKYCSNKCKGISNYIRGYWLDKDGYAIKKVNGVNKRVHRIVMGEKLGRKLLDTEIVHHIDHNKLNNRPENLILYSSHREHKMKEHPGAWNKGKKMIPKFQEHESNVAYTSGSYAKFL